MLVQCKDFTESDCPIIFEGEENSICEQLSMHLIGSHGIKLSASSIAAFYNPVVKEKVAKIETIKDIEKIDGQPKKKTSKKKWWLNKKA
jgi:hypothetical protein